MCQFFSCISDDKGKVAYFTVQDIVEQMSLGNPETYDWNSHTSIAHFIGLSPTEEDKWNKWEYNTNTKKITADSLVTTDDRKKVLVSIKKYLKDKDLAFLLNFYNRNSGNCNSGDYNFGWFNTDEPTMRFFNQPSDIKYSNFANSKRCPNLSGWRLIVWVSESEMTPKEKKANLNHKTLGGYLKVIEYKKAWKVFWSKTSKTNKEKFLKLPNFDSKVFEEITGIKV